MNKNILFLAIALVAAGAFYLYRMPRFSSGQPLPDFVVKTASGTTIHLSELRGKTVLIHFWGSWCGPCRRENPHLVDLYAKYKDKGFEIMSIAIERNPAGWQKAIEADGMNWPIQAMESGNFDGPVASMFNVKEIPSLYLVNKEGVLMTRNPSLDVLGKILSEQCR
jgi:thiol-disulfide isomerase/thioredoxin